MSNTISSISGTGCDISRTRRCNQRFKQSATIKQSTKSLNQIRSFASINPLFIVFILVNAQQITESVPHVDATHSIEPTAQSALGDCQADKLVNQIISAPLILNPSFNNHTIDERSPDKDDNIEKAGSYMELSSFITQNGCPSKLRIAFDVVDRRFVIDLVKNEGLISDKYFKIIRDSRLSNHTDHNRSRINSSSSSSSSNHMFLNLHNFSSNRDHCHYHGTEVNQKQSAISAISIMDSKLLSGFFLVDGETLYLHPNVTDHTTILSRSAELCSRQSGKNQRYDLIDGETKLRFRRAARARKPAMSDNNILHEPFKSNSDSLYVELLVVHDHSQFTEYKGNSTFIAERTMQVVNIMNAFYRQLNIFISLVGVVLWTERDEIELTEDGDATLTNFLKYRYEKLLPKYHHDNAQLITSTSFNGSVVGKALKGPICTHEHSGGVNTDHSHNPAIIAVTLAHELGHNFGMEHDEEEKCTCPDEKCIMSSSSSAVHPKHWSSCSIEHLSEARSHGLLDCLKNLPQKAFGPTCGNGLVEEGEDCDLGEPIPTYMSSKSRKKCNPSQENCDLTSSMNSCCDRQTCKFKANATCAQGPCCDLKTCSIYNGTDTKVCRQRKGECDLEEVCDGISEYCPPDVFYHDGIECGPNVGHYQQANRIESNHLDFPGGSLGNFNRTRSFCYNGKCASHESQCQLLWGQSAYDSKDICYSQNVHGNTSGNCGYNRREKLYNSCELEDVSCGMLHCVHHQAAPSDNSRKTGKLNYGFESESILTVSFFVMSNNDKIYCHGAIVDAGPDVPDPGLVPNGASCGDEKMCLDQRCVPVHEVIYKNWCASDCNGNGICDNRGKCHCYDGTIGTSCYQFFGANFHLSLAIYMVLFFLPVVGLTLFALRHYKGELEIWWFLHNRKIMLRKRAREESHANRMPYEISNQHNISISDPIPLNSGNQQLTAQSRNNPRPKPAYDPLIDPWAETDCGGSGTNSLGFRLEPLNRGNNSEHSASNLVAGLVTQPNEDASRLAANLRPVRPAPPPPPPGL